MAYNAAQKIVAKFDELYKDASNWRNKMSEISEWIVPERGKYLTGTPLSDDTSKKGTKKHDRILNGIAGKYIMTLAANMQAGMTSPAQEWVRLTTANHAVAAISSVKDHVYTLQKIVLSALARSNFYNITPGIYTELSTFGTGAYLIEKDPETFIRFRPFTAGEFYFTLDARYRPNALYRKFTMSANQMEEMFGKNKLSLAARQAFEANTGESRFEVIHVIKPNDNSVPGVRKAFKYMSVYLEESEISENKFLSTGGYNSKPFVIVRWESVGTDAFGISPAMEALGDVKQLQAMTETMLQALQLNVRPPMNTTADMMNKPRSLVPGALNIINPMHGAAGFAPALQVHLDTQATSMQIEKIEQRLYSFFYNDILNAFLRSTNRKTATEIEEQSKEKLLSLGPVIESTEDEMLDDTIFRVIDILDEMGFIPPPPPEMAGSALKIEYEGFLSQAQKAVRTIISDQLFAHIFTVAGMAQEARFKYNAFADIDEYAANLGGNPRVIRSDEEAMAMMQEEQRALQQQQAMQQIGDAASTAKVLGDTPLGDATALDAILQGVI